jgi:hypothetical protein
VTPQLDENELDWEYVRESGRIVRRIGRSRQNLTLLIDIRYDEHERQTEKTHFGDDGELRRRIVYEYDAEPKPKLTLAYDRADRLIWPHKRGERPEDLSQ